MNGCPGLYWHGKKTCQQKLVAAVSQLLNVHSMFYFMWFKAISSLKPKSDRQILISTKNSSRMSISYFSKDQKQTTDEVEKVGPKCRRNRRCLKKASYLKGKRIQPMMKSKRLYLQISNLGRTDWRGRWNTYKRRECN